MVVEARLSVMTGCMQYVMLQLPQQCEDSLREDDD